jgi:hypothetical protein
MKIRELSAWIREFASGLVSHGFARRPVSRSSVSVLMQTEPLEARQLLAFDFGDAPDRSYRTGVGDYQTLAVTGGPRHRIDESFSSLFIGSRVDSEPGSFQGPDANLDDQSSPKELLGQNRGDEDGIVNPLDLEATVGDAPSVTVRVTNTTDRLAVLSGWLDVNRNGAFDNATERVQVRVPTGSSDLLVTMQFPVLPLGPYGVTYLRLRLSTDAAAQEPHGPATDGEVEDHRFVIQNQIREPYKVLKAVNIGDRFNGGPDIGDSDAFGWASASIGDLNRDGIQDVVVTAPRDGGRTVSRGAVYVLFMNTDGRAKASVKIADKLNGGPVIAAWDLFGTSVTSLGDIDGDGNTDIAVGAAWKGSNPYTDQGAVYIICLNRNGTAKRVTELRSEMNGVPHMWDHAGFGAVEAIADLNGDGVIDLAVGAPQEITGTIGQGVLYVLMMNADGTVSKSARITNSKSPHRSTGGGELFAQELAFLGDIDGDGTTELAVLSDEYISGNWVSRNIDLLSLTSNGTVQKSVRVNDSRIGVGSFPTVAEISGMSAVGDLDGNGVTDLAFSTSYLSETPPDGALYFLLLNSDGTTKAIHTVGSSPQAPTLGKSFWMGGSITPIGDLNADGHAEFLMGFPGFNPDKVRGTLTGGLTVLSLRSEVLNTRVPTAPVLTMSASPNNARPVFSWPEIDSARTYEVWLQNTTTKAILADGSIGSGLKFTPEAPLPIGRYLLKVRTRNEAGLSVWSMKLWIVDSPVQVPEVPDFHTRRPALKWTALPGAAKYEVRILDGRTGRLAQTAILTSNNTTWVPPKELPIASYKLTIRGIAADGTAGAWSALDEFRVGSLVTVPTLGPSINPRPIISWLPLSDAVEYEMLIARAENPGTEALRISTAATSFEPVDPLPEGAYVVRIRATTATGIVTEWSAPQSFSVEVPVLEALPLEVGPRTISVLRWAAISGARHYQVRVNHPMRPSGELIVDRFTQVSSTRFELPMFFYQGQYEICVRAIDQNGAVGHWRTVTQSVLAKIDNISAGHLPGMIRWAPVATATSYRVRYTEVLKSGRRILFEDLTTRADYTPSVPLPLGTVEVDVRPVTPDGTEGHWSAVVKHISRPAPLIPKLHLQVISETVTLKWEPVAGAVSYNVMVRRPYISPGSKQNYEIVVHLRSHEALSLTIPHLEQGDYHWWVQANNAEGFLGEWSAQGSVRTKYSLDIKDRDASWISQSPLLAWYAGPEAASYNVVVREQSSGHSMFEQSGLKTNQIRIPELAAGAYEWIVQAVDAEGNTSRWSTPGIVRTGAPPRITISNVYWSLAEFHWKPLLDAASYEFELRLNGWTVRKERNLTSTYFSTPTTNLYDRTVYQAIVRAFAADGTTFTYDSRDIMVKP